MHKFSPFLRGQGREGSNLGLFEYYCPRCKAERLPTVEPDAAPPKGPKRHYTREGRE